MTMSNKSEPNSFNDRLQPDPMLRTGRANTVWLWIVIGAIAAILTVTAVGVFGGNHILQSARNSIIGDPPLPNGMSKRGQGAVLNDRSPSEALPNDKVNSTTR